MTAVPPAGGVAPGPQPERPSAARRVRVPVAIALTAAVAAWVAYGIVRNGGGPGDGSAGVPMLSAEEFAERAAQADAFVVNVHVPYAGEIKGTDAFIPYDRIAGDSQLPHDPGIDILLYCQSGRMSEIAGEALLADGHTNVAHLGGGMGAWAAAGFEVRQRDR